MQMAELFFWGCCYQTRFASKGLDADGRIVFWADYQICKPKLEIEAHHIVEGRHQLQTLRNLVGIRNRSFP